jgi:hypothetical protein
LGFPTGYTYTPSPSHDDKKVKSEGLIKGLVPHLVDEGVAILQYADDIILLMEDSLENARNMKFIFCLFEQVLGLKFNFHNIEIFCLGAARERIQQYSEIFTCPIDTLPMKYLGMPIDKKRLAVSKWDPIAEKMGKKLSGWKGNMLSHGDRLTLVNACLSSITLYMLSFMEAPKGFLMKADIIRITMIWPELEDKKKYHLVKWDIVCDSCIIQHLYLKFKSHLFHENDKISLSPLPLTPNYHQAWKSSL